MATVTKIKTTVNEKMKFVKKPNSDLFEIQQLYHDEVFKIYQDAFKTLIDGTITYSTILNEIKNAYENAIQVRNERISQFITEDVLANNTKSTAEHFRVLTKTPPHGFLPLLAQMMTKENKILRSLRSAVTPAFSIMKKVFGISVRKKQRDDKMKKLMKENEELKEQNLKLTFEIIKLKKDLGKIKDDKFSDYLILMRERDARYTLYFENLGLQMKLKELDGSSYPVDQAYGDPVVLRIALDRCREQLTTTQTTLAKMTEEYADTVPRREFDRLEARHSDVSKALDAVRAELRALQDSLNKLLDKKKSIEEELFEVKERCRELERAGTPRPQWEICADFIGGGRDRWWQLANGLSSRDILRALLKELGPAAENDHLEHFDGLGTDPAVPPYLRLAGRVRNLRLSRREVGLIINDIWLGKADHKDVTMQDYVTNYFEDRYQQPSMRAEWAYNLCAGAEQMLDEPQVKLFWGVLHGHLSELIYWGLSDQWRDLKHQLYKQSKDKETISMEEFEKVCKAMFPLKSEVDIKNLSDVVRKQLKIKISNNEVNLDKLFQENEEGFDRIEFARELYRQRQLAQDKYIREVVAELGGRRAPNKPVTVDGLKRAFAIVDPAIDHVRMERYIRWAFSEPSGPLEAVAPAPLRALAARLAAGDIERAGPRYRASHGRGYKSMGSLA